MVSRAGVRLLDSIGASGWLQGMLGWLVCLDVEAGLTVVTEPPEEEKKKEEEEKKKKEKKKKEEEKKKNEEEKKKAEEKKKEEEEENKKKGDIVFNKGLMAIIRYVIQQSKKEQPKEGNGVPT